MVIYTVYVLINVFCTGADIPDLPSVELCDLQSYVETLREDEACDEYQVQYALLSMYTSSANTVCSMSRILMLITTTSLLL